MIEPFFLATLVFMFIGGVFHGLVGFGFPMIVTPILTLFSDVKSAILTTLFPTLFVNSTSILFVKDRFKVLKSFWLLAFFVAIGSFFGTQILIHYPYEFYKLLLAFVMIIYLLKEKLYLNFHGIGDMNSKIFMIFVGFISGIVGGLTNVLVSVLIIYILELKLPKSISIVVMNFCFFSSKITQIIIFSSLGFIQKDDIINILLMLLSTFLGFLIGKGISKKISILFYQKLLRFSLWLLSFALIFQYII